MAPTKLLDTHIHLWPASATSSSAHGWMTSGHFLAKRHGIAEYKAATAGAAPDGFVYVETDRYLPTPEPDIQPSDAEDVIEEKLKTWAAEPLKELSFLRRMVEGSPTEGDEDGFTPSDSALLKGMVIYAPFQLSTALFTTYLRLARETLGAQAWSKVVGFRYLLQGRGVTHVRTLVQSEDFVRNLRSIEGKVFDVGVDCHRDGVEVLDWVGEMVERVAKLEEGVKPKFVLSMCPPPSIAMSFPLGKVCLA